MDHTPLDRADAKGLGFVSCMPGRERERERGRERERERAVQHPYQQPPTSQPHASQGPPSTSQQSTHNTYPHHTPPSTATARAGTPGLWAREYDPDTDPWHTPPNSPREPTQQQQQPPWAQHESPQPNPAFASNPPWSLTHEQAASLLAESPTLHAQKHKQDELDHNQEPGSPPPLPPPSDAPPGLNQATSTEQHTSTGETEEATMKEDTGAPAEDTHSQWYHGSSPHEATVPSADTYWDPQWGTTANEPLSYDHHPTEEPASSATTPPQQEAPPPTATDTTEEAPTSANWQQQQEAPAATRPAPWERDPNWGTRRIPPSSSRRTEATAGHGSQRIRNKAGKYVYKQHNKHGNRQWRPPPQSQGGPGWGILYRPQTSDNNTTQSSSSSSHNWGQPSDSSTGSQSWGDHPPQTQPQTPQPGTKADTYARERFADLLNRHTLPRDTIPSRMQQEAGTTDTAQAEARHEPRQHNTPAGRPSTSHSQHPQPHQPRSNQQPPPSSRPTTNTAPERKATHTAQAEWAATQPDFETPPDLPPDFSLPTASAAPTEFTTLTHGCWEVRVRPAQQPSSSSGDATRGGNQRGLPVLYVPYLGQAGPLDRAPPFTRGTIGRIAPMPQGNAWLLIITSTPNLDDYEHNAMLTVEGDKFMIEASDKGWRQRVEHLAPSAARAGRSPTRPPKAVPKPADEAPETQPKAATDPTAPTTAAYTEAEPTQRPAAAEPNAEPRERPDRNTEAQDDPDTTPLQASTVDTTANNSDTASPQAPATEAAAGDDDSPVQWFEDYEDSPPHVPLSQHSQAEVSQLGAGRWRLAIRADKGKSTKKLAGLPLAVVEGEGGDIDNAPPLPIGLEGTLEFLTEDLWVLVIELTPPHPNYEQDTMLLSPGDRLLLERTLTGWQIRVEHLDPNCPPPIRRLRQRRREALEAAAQARKGKTTAAGTRDTERLPTIPEGSNSKSSTDAGNAPTKPAPPQTPATEQAGRDAEQTAGSSSSSSHERPQSYYPQTRKPTTTATGDRPHVNTLADGRELRKSQQNRPTQPQQPSTQQQTTEPSLAEALSDGRNIGKRGTSGERTTTTTTEAPSYSTTTTTDTTAPNTTTPQAESDSAPLMQTHRSLAATARSGTRTPPGGGTARPAVEEVVMTQEQTPTTPIASPTLETQPPPPLTASSSNASSGVHLVSLHTPTPQQMEGTGTGEPSSGSNDPQPPTRSWQRVEQKLLEIRRIAEQHNGSQAEAIAQAADTALIDLLVDTPTALQLEGDTNTHPPHGGDAAAAATYAAQQLRSIGRALMSRSGSVAVPYAMVAPHVAALIAWLETLDRGNVAVHVQLPPVLTPLREILDQILRGQPNDVATWARLVAVAEAFEALVTGNVLTHPADVVGQSQGEMESPLMCTEGTIPNWYRAVETLRALLGEVPQWPVRVLPTLQQAATNLVRGIAIATPTEDRGGPGEWTPEPWWYQERHHGLGDTARAPSGGPETSPRGRAQRRPRSPSSDASHRRRRLLAEHVHDEDL